jgi:hypothetical protein
MEISQEYVSNWVLRNILIFFFLQEFDYYRQSGDSNSQNVMSRFTKERYPGLSDDFQLMNLDTSLGILLPIFAYSARITPNDWEEVGFSIAPHYKCVTYDRDGRSCVLNTDRFLRIVRNALAHYADFFFENDNPTILFEPEVIQFKARDGKIHFPEVGGYIHFLSDFLRATKAVIRRRY